MSRKPVPPPGAALIEARRLLDAGRPQDAIRLCQGALAARPDDAEAFNLAGIAFFRLGDPAEAASLFETALAYRPDFAEAANNLGNVLAAEGKTEDALSAYGRALDVRPDYADARFNRAAMLEAQGRLSDAAADYEKAATIDPGFAPAWFGLGTALKAQGRLKDAEAALRRCLSLSPDFADALVNLGAVRQETGDLAEATGLFRRAVAARPNFAEGHYNLGVALQEQGDPQAALAAYADALVADPGHVGAMVNAGFAERQRGDLAAAEAHYRGAAAAAPDYDKAHVNLADLQLERGDGAGALEIADRFLARQPGNTSMLAFKAVLLGALGRATERDRLLDPALLKRVRVAPGPEFADLGAFNRALSDHVLAHPTLVHAPASHATRNGRHSGELLSPPLGPMAAFEARIRAAVDAYGAEDGARGHPFLAHRPARYRLNVWGVVMGAQGHQVSHIHPAAWLSGVYYPRVPEAIRATADGAGWIEFGRPPEDFAVRPDAAVETVRPEEGLLLLFPSYFHHRTIPFAAGEERISIAFDVLAADGRA